MIPMEEGTIMRKVSVYDAKTNLSKYMAMLRDGVEDEIIVCNNGKEEAKLVAIRPKQSPGLVFGTGLKYLNGDNKGDPFVGDEEISKEMIGEKLW